jgi:hypothetical protein
MALIQDSDIRALALEREKHALTSMELLDQMERNKELETQLSRLEQLLQVGTASTYSAFSAQNPPRSIKLIASS